MTSLDRSSSGAESSMDDASNGNLKRSRRRHQSHSNGGGGGGGGGAVESNVLRYGGGGGDDGDEECDGEVWETFNQSFRQVQTVLDQNRALIQQVNENHQSKLPDNLTKNVALIREINGNISKVVTMYSDLGVNFSNVFQERRMKNKGVSPEA
ncbi:hypothetical protein Scep_005646 [Stephania cephalantha]|uniref:Protein EARLY FLOWERING 4 domain-containing protein n=1 Tax=Stephania cephalantha TaxID=152367 RepID=A0AAP0KUR3_9MAGN